MEIRGEMLICPVRPKPERQVQQTDCASWDLELLMSMCYASRINKNTKVAA